MAMDNRGDILFFLKIFENDSLIVWMASITYGSS